MVHLAATGDHGYTRRTHLGLPLVQQVKGLLAVLQYGVVLTLLCSHPACRPGSHCAAILVFFQLSCDWF